MKANKNSIHSKLYYFTYDSDLPDNLCPYFWKLLFAFLVFIPNLIIKFPYFILDKLFFKHEYNTSTDQTAKGLMTWILLFIIYSISFVNWHLIKAIFNCYSYISECANLALGFDIICLIIISIIIYNYHVKKDMISDTINIPIEFIKAKYNNYCPKIDWK